MTTGRVVTFYSYKGGVGRTQALANIGTLLSRWGYKVLCVDWDLEAPGLDRYFRKLLPQPIPPTPGVVELIQRYAEGKRPDWKQHLVEMRIGSGAHSLSLMPAGIQDESYKSHVQNLDWAVLYERHELGAFIESVRDQWKASYDFILVDSRTGITDIGGICTIQLPDLLVLLFTANHQSLDGIVDVWRSALVGRDRFAFDRARLLALPVATRFEQRVEYTRAQEWMQIFAEKLEPLFAEWATKDVSIPEMLGLTRIPYVPYWSFGEELPILEEDGKDPEQISFAFETVGALIAKGLEGTDLLVRAREAYVSGAWKSPPLRSDDQQVDKTQKPVRVFLSYSYRDTELVGQLITHLATLKRQGAIDQLYDRTISSGARWRSEVDVHIEEADIILFCLSADFLASEYAVGAEVARAFQRAKEGRAWVIPILVRPVSWGATPFAQVSMLPPGPKAVTSHSNHEEAWANIVQGIHERARGVRTGAAPSVLLSSKREQASFTTLEAMLDELPGLARTLGQPGEPPTKNVALGPEDASPLDIAPDKLKEIIRACTVEIQGWGGRHFPYDRADSSQEIHSQNGLQLMNTQPWSPASSASFDLWEMRFSGHFRQRQLLNEDYLRVEMSGRENTQGRLSVEWALIDIVRPLLFARNLIEFAGYEGRFSVKYAWNGLQGRSLIVLSQRRWGLGFEKYVSVQASWRFECTLVRGADLYEAAHGAAQALFWQFGWDNAMNSSVPEQLRTLLDGRYPD